MSCTVCNHPQRQAIDLVLLNRTATLAQLSRQYNLSQSALHRHKQHLLKKMAQTENRFQHLLREGYLVILNSFLQLIMPITQTANAEGNTRLLLQAVRQGTAIIKFMQKLDFNLDLDTIYRLLDSPQSADQGSLLPADLKFFAGTKQAMAASLFASCPEPASDQEPDLGLGLEDSAALAELAGLDPDLLQNLLTNLTQSLGLPGSAPAPGKREKSGKKAKNDHGFDRKSKQYQHHGLFEKNAGKLPVAAQLTALPPAFQPGRPCLQGQSLSKTDSSGGKLPGKSNSWIQDLDDGRLDINTLHAIGVGRPVDLDLSKYAVAA